MFAVLTLIISHLGVHGSHWAAYLETVLHGHQIHVKSGDITAYWFISLATTEKIRKMDRWTVMSPLFHLKRSERETLDIWQNRTTNQIRVDLNWFNQICFQFSMRHLVNTQRAKHEICKDEFSKIEPRPKTWARAGDQLSWLGAPTGHLFFKIACTPC